MRTAYPQVCAEWRSGRVKGEAGARYLSFPPMKSSPDDEMFCAPIATSLRERMRPIYGVYVAVFVKASGAICVRERGGRWRGVGPCDGGAHAHNAGDAIVHDEPASDMRSTHVLNVLHVLGGLPAVNGPDSRCPRLWPYASTRCRCAPRAAAGVFMYHLRRSCARWDSVVRGWESVAGGPGSFLFLCDL